MSMELCSLCELALTRKARSTAHIQIRTRWNTYAETASYHFSMQQSHPAALVPFASLSAISGTFNSLFKVLFTFPSWYLFAIGLEPIFSLRWNLPPNLRSNPKERDSQNIHRAQGTADGEQESHPHWYSFPRDLHLRLHWQYISRLQFKAKDPNFQAELIPVHSPLLGESYLVSHPPLTYMLKFSGFADLTSCPWLPKSMTIRIQHAMQCNNEDRRSPQFRWLLAPAMPEQSDASGSRTWRTDFHSEHLPWAAATLERG